MNIDRLREEQDIELQEQMWDTDCDLSKLNLYTGIGLSDGSRWKLGDLISDTEGVYKIVHITESGIDLETVAKVSSIFNMLKIHIPFDSLLNRYTLWKSKEELKVDCQISFDRENVSSDYDYDILDVGRGLI